MALPARDPRWLAQTATPPGGAKIPSTATYVRMGPKTRSGSPKRDGDGAQWRVAQLATRQHGVVSRAQLRALGATDTSIAHALAVGRLHPVFHGVFAVGHPHADSLSSRLLAAVLACGPGTVVSHVAAAKLLGLWDSPPSVVTVIALRQLGREIPGIRRSYVPYPQPEEIEVRKGIPCTAPFRTLVDLAGILGTHSLRKVVQQAAFRRALDIPAIDTALARHRRRGAPRLRAILADWRPVSPDADLRSPLEARLLPMIVSRSLPVPLCNHRVPANGRKCMVDLFWPRQRLVVEADSRTYHDNPIAFEEDRRRDRDLIHAGYRVLRVTRAQLDHEPEAVLATIARLLA